MRELAARARKKAPTWNGRAAWLRARSRLTLLLYALLILVLTAGPAAAGPAPQSGLAAALLNQMSPEEKVGQLFMVTYQGASVGPGTAIEELVTQHHVGGVMLLTANDNFTDVVAGPAQVLSVTNQLQALAAWGTPGGLAAPANSPTETVPLHVFIPLFIASTHEGGVPPFTALPPGLTEIPEAMAIGATWDPAQAEAMGQIVGRELATLGINMLLGPSLDVLDTPRPQGPNDLGTRVFGGDPYWVGQMGQAYIRGVHAGSVRRVAVVARHFPGLGSSDRDPEMDQDVPTVHRVLDQLKQVELAPFLAAATPLTDSADGFLTAHIRYAGFQGNPRQTTNPISFDQAALAQLMSLPELAAWRERGGLLVSDSLGARAIKRFFDPTERTFNNKRIAREAFAAGNDVLLLSEFGHNPADDQTATIIDTLVYFSQQYSADTVFAEKVDAAVLRILTAKLKLYPQFSLAQVQRPEEALAGLGFGGGQVQTLAQAAASLVGVSLDETAARAPDPPTASDRIVIFTDGRQARQCSVCAPYAVLDRRALERSLVRLYGPGGSAEVREGNLQSFTFEDLAEYLASAPAPAPGLETPTPEPPALETALNSANWVVFNLLNITPDAPASGVIRTFLAQRPELARAKKVVVFAFSAPYYLDTTDISKLTAYYALYSRAPAFVDMAARLLFRDLAPRGASPVSVESAGYVISSITAPDGAQVIDIVSDSLKGNVGDTLRLRTGVIRDRNGHPVPDGTPVRFLVLYKDDVLPALVSAATSGGVAETQLTLNRIGQVQIWADSEPAMASITLQINVQQGTPFVITVVAPAPTAQATATLAPTSTPIPPTPTPVPPTATPVKGGVLTTPGRVAGRDFFMMCLFLGAAVLAGYRLGEQSGRPERRLRLALAGAIGVLVGYNLFALGLVGADLAARAFGVWAASTYVLAGGSLGLLAGWYGFRRR